MDAAPSQSEIQSAIKKVGKASETKDEMVLMMTLYSNWEELMLSAPASVSILGTLISLSTAADFSLLDSAPQGGFQALHTPQSFSACLVQVANSGWRAFNLAHKNMNQIRLLCGQVPGHFENSVKILCNGSIEDIQDLLPVELEQISSVATKGYTLSKEVEDKFDSVIEIIEELKEASVSFKGSHEEKLRENQRKKRLSEQHLKQLEEQKRAMEKLCEKNEKEVLEAEEIFKKYCNSVPSAKTFLFMQLAENVVNHVGNAIPLLGAFIKVRQVIPAIALGAVAKGVVSPRSARKKQASAVRTPLEVTEVSLEFRNLETQLDQLASLCKESEQNVPETLKQQKMRENTAKECLEFGKRISVTENLAESMIVEKYIALCERVIRLDKGGMDKEEKKAISDEIKELDVKIKVLLFNATKYAQQLAAPPPQAAQKLQGTTATENAAYSVMYKVECSKEHLTHIRALHEKRHDNLNNVCTTLMATMNELSSIDLQEINFQDIKEILSKGIEALADLKQQWAKIVRFFQMVSNIIKCCVQTSVKSFSDHADKTRERQLADSIYTLTDLRKDIIYKKAFEGAKIAHLVHMISQTYVRVSEEHIMDNIAGLPKMLAYDSETQAELIDKEKSQLIETCKTAQEEIKILVAEEREKFNQQLDARLITIEEAFDKALPPPTREKKEIMEKAIAQAQDDLGDYY